MKPPLLTAYHALPSFARNWAATAHGYALKSVRYGSATPKMIDEAMARESWTPSQWEEWLSARRNQVLRTAAEQVPYYQRYWAERRRLGDHSSLEVLANWPILKKECVRQQPELFLANHCVRRKMSVEHTSGTTGTPLKLWRSQLTAQKWYALNEARVRLWNGLSRQDRWGHVGGQPVVPLKQSHPPYWVWNGALNQLYLSSMHLGVGTSAAYLAAIREYRLKYLLGYASSLAVLAQAVLDAGVNLPMQQIITDSEPLLMSQREIIEKAFCCPVRETYGMAEIACAASECRAGSLHLWPEVGFIELLDENDHAVAPGEVGRIIATQLINPDMPLIRYDTQDLAQAEPEGSLCACGRTLPILRKLLGRNDDVVLTADGRRLVLIDRVFESGYDIQEGQIIQEDISRFTINVVPGRKWTLAQGQALCADLHNLVGKAEINLELVSQIERTWAGKHRIIISKVSNRKCQTPPV